MEQLDTIAAPDELEKSLESANNPIDPPYVIDMREIVKSFNIGTENELEILHGINLQIPAGQFVSIVGASGSGKSTLMNIVGMLDRPTAGEYFLAGENMGMANEEDLATIRNHRIGFVFQNFNLIGRTSAQKNVELPLMYGAVRRAERARRAKELLTMVGMESRLDHQPSELSGGQKQRVAIARALANDPSLILADEPTGALDTGTGRMVMDLFHQLHEEQGKTIVLITHNDELARETQRIVVMRDGYLEE